jgi:putative membrane protein
MTDFIIQNYDWIKAFHIIAVISWMAGMLYLPRLFVYHASAPKGGELSETLKVMERKLLRLIINPAMILAWIFGGLMFWTFIELDTLKEAKWLHHKMTLLILMQIVHAMLANARRKFAEDRNTKSARYYRWLNEAPTVLMIAIVILAIVKPF